MGVCAKLIHSKHSLHTVPVALPHMMGRREDMEDSVPVLLLLALFTIQQLFFLCHEGRHKDLTSDF